jgi:hypothetical protein
MATAIGDDGRVTPARSKGKWLALGAVTLATMALASLALHDVTTDNATQFPAEYSLLAVSGAWLLLVAWQLWPSGSRLNAAIFVVSVVSAAWLSRGGIGHLRDGGWSVFWLQYLVLTWAWIHGIVVGILMIRRGLRGTGAG